MYNRKSCRKSTIRLGIFKIVPTMERHITHNWRLYCMEDVKDDR